MNELFNKKLEKYREKHKTNLSQYLIDCYPYSLINHYIIPFLQEQTNKVEYEEWELNKDFIFQKKFVKEEQYQSFLKYQSIDQYFTDIYEILQEDNTFDKISGKYLELSDGNYYAEAFYIFSKIHNLNNEFTVVSPSNNKLKILNRLGRLGTIKNNINGKYDFIIINYHNNSIEQLVKAMGYLKKNGSLLISLKVYDDNINHKLYNLLENAFTIVYWKIPQTSFILSQEIGYIVCHNFKLENIKIIKKKYQK
jgi:hypothetical protein